MRKKIDYFHLSILKNKNNNKMLGYCHRKFFESVIKPILGGQLEHILTRLLI